MSKDKSSNTTKQEKNTQDTQEKLAYNPKSIESTIYQICKNRGYFEIDGNSGIAKKRQARLKQHSDEITPKDTHFCIMMPPPNVTGVLHIGHALTLSLQDIIVRYKRMQGFVTLYQPGLDHAGIATQNIVEKQLLTKGVKKEELGREAFINKVWEWKEESGGKILGQMEALGITPALSRTRFTMDKGLQQAVREAFVAWYEKGLIYQGDYMVNWCTHDGALSDIEVHYEGQETKLYYIAYKIANGNSSLGEGNSSNSPAGSHCIDLLDFESSQTLQSSSPPKSSKNSTSTTLRARIVGENGGDTCHTEEAQATEVSQTQLKNRDISGLSPQYDKDINSPSLAEGALAWVDSNNSPSPNCQNVAEVVESRNDTNDTFPQDALVVATTRPETFFGDVAVMINPNDSRYAHLIGQKVILPLLNKEIPIIADNAVDMEFGTGIVKVTPAHDINDYEVGKRHGLENLVIFDEKGILNENALDFAGRERLEARDDIVSALKSCGALLKTEPYHNQVGTCYRCGNIIEPYISKQWFVSKEVAKNAIKRVNDGESRFYPSSWLNNFNAWMRELRPWCISRQLWWGHRIPIWDCENPNCAHRFASKNEVESSCPKCGGEVRQDSDVLDTWFSSGLWAFSTLGWGNSNNSPLGMQCGKILDFLECTDAKSANIPKNPKNLHSHTANTRIVDSSKQIDSSENGSLSSLDKNPQDSRGNLSGIASDLQNTQLELQGDCHESAYADSRNDEKTRECNADFDKSISNDNMACRPEGVGNNARSISNAQNRDFSLIAQNDNDRDISGLSPQYDKNTSALYNHDDLSNFYPNSLLITGFDILFFWVARMLFSGESLLGKLPFRDVYLHALVRDENGQKMSKSRGNVIDPLEMIDKYGADSLRFSLAYLCAQGRDIRLSSAQLELSKNFANKLFNATQFLILYARQMDSNFNGFTEIGTIAQYQTSLGKYAKSRLNVANKELIDALESYRFNDGASVLYRFLWGEFCDWCIELAKAQKEAINELGSVLIDALKLLHPYMPFISEDLYHTLKGQKLQSSQSIMIAEFPSDFAQDLHIEAEFEGIKNAVISLRRLKASVDLANKPLQKAYIEFDNYTPNTTQKALESIQKLSRIQFVELFDSTQVNIKQCVADIGEGVKCYLPLSEIDLSPILSRLNSQKQKLQKECDKLESNLKNDKFLSNAPKEVVAKLESNLKETQQRLDKIQSEINALDMR